MASSSSASCSDSDCIDYNTFHELSRLGLLLISKERRQKEAYSLELLEKASVKPGYALREIP